jgi:hypothetical protein
MKKLSDYAKKIEVPQKTSELLNDSGYINNIVPGVVLSFNNETKIALVQPKKLVNGEWIEDGDPVEKRYDWVGKKSNNSDEYIYYGSVYYNDDFYKVNQIDDPDKNVKDDILYRENMTRIKAADLVFSEDTEQSAKIETQTMYNTLFIVFVPKKYQYNVCLYNAYSGNYAFEEIYKVTPDDPGVDCGANKLEMTIDGVDYEVYGQLSLVDSNITFKIGKNIVLN